MEFPFFPSFPTPGAPERQYLADSVAFVLEVKSDLSSQWSEVEATSEKVMTLRRSWQSHMTVTVEGDVEDNSASESRIPIVAVGYRGHKSIEALSERLRTTSPFKRPDALLIVESGAYLGMIAKGIGAAGLFAFCVDASHMAKNVLWASLDFGRYEALLKEPPG